WLSAGIQWPYILMGGFITTAILKRESVQKIFWKISLLSILILFLFDISQEIIYQQLTFKSITQNVFSNFVGGGVVGIICVVMLFLANFLFVHIPSGKAFRQVITFVAIVLFGIGVNCFAYYLAEFFYNPLPVGYESYIAAPASA